MGKHDGVVLFSYDGLESIDIDAQFGTQGRPR
jgi:hypothetical protein